MDTANIVGSASLIIAAWTVIVGINAWRREYVGKRNVEFAEEVLVLFYEARDAIRFMRNPGGYVGEGSTRKAGPNESPEEKDIRDKAYVVFERYNERKELFNKLYSMRYHYIARFGNTATNPFDDLQKLVNEIFISARMLTHYWMDQGHRKWKNDAEFRRHLAEMHKYEAVFWEMTPDRDQITPKVDAVISEIEAKFARIISPSWFERIKQWFI
ncbi:MAG: hypothetical protein H8E40_03270 [Chloroflexi bacterium]|nr:hypothetical protein [Chloroflexota bacterium]MBL7166634.1 hypothetical protein [Dehalococcoidales bacterium]